MKKNELVAKVAAQAGVDKSVAERVIDALGPAIGDTLKNGGNVILPGLVKFSAVHKDARTGRNPATGAALQIPAKTVPKVVVLTAFKDAVA